MTLPTDAMPIASPNDSHVCVYRPSLVLLPVNQADHYEYRWNAAGEVNVLKLTDVGTA